MNRLTFFLLLAVQIIQNGVAAPALRSLKETQYALGFTNFIWNGDSVTLSNDSHCVRFYQGRRKADVNNVSVWLNVAPDGLVTDDAWRITKTDLDFLQISILPETNGPQKRLRVMIDAGHGGSDHGAVNKKANVKEKDINLAVAQAVGALLSSNNMEVLYTRTNDETLSLDDRSRLARKRKADLFISIHANFADNTTASGVETYITQPPGFAGTTPITKARGFQIGNAFDYQNTMLGFEIHRRLCQLTPDTVDRGLKRQAFYVLREISCPATLIEVGFLSNPEEVRRMVDKPWQHACAYSIATGILAYASKLDGLTLRIAEKRKLESKQNEAWIARKAQLKKEADLAAAAKTATAAVRDPHTAPLQTVVRGVEMTVSNVTPEETASTLSTTNLLARSTPVTMPETANQALDEGESSEQHPVTEAAAAAAAEAEIKARQAPAAQPTAAPVKSLLEALDIFDIYSH